MAEIYVGPLDAAAHDLLSTLRGVAYSETQIHVGFLTTGPADSAGTGAVELVHADYARQPVAFAAPTGRSMASSGSVTFTGSASGSWNSGAPIRLVGYWDAATGGNLLMVDLLSPPVTVVAGSPVIIPAGQLRVRFLASTATV